MQYAIIIAIAVILLAIGCFVSYRTGYENKRKADEEKIGNAEQKAREIIDEALKTAEAKKEPVKKTTTRKTTKKTTE